MIFCETFENHVFFDTFLAILVGVFLSFFDVDNSALAMAVANGFLGFLNVESVGVAGAFPGAFPVAMEGVFFEAASSSISSSMTWNSLKSNISSEANRPKLFSSSDRVPSMKRQKGCNYLWNEC